jgi:hypothetical protein
VTALRDPDVQRELFAKGLRSALWIALLFAQLSDQHEICHQLTTIVAGLDDASASSLAGDRTDG